MILSGLGFAFVSVSNVAPTDVYAPPVPPINDYMRFRHYMRSRDINGLKTIPWSIILDYQRRVQVDGLDIIGEGIHGTSNMDAVMTGYEIYYPNDASLPFGPLFKYGDGTTLIKLDAWSPQQGDLYTLAYLTPASNGYTNVSVNQEYHADTFMRDFGIGLVALATAGAALSATAPAAASAGASAAEVAPSGALIAPVSEVASYAGTAAMQAAATSDAAFNAYVASAAAAESAVPLAEFGGTAIAESLGTSTALATLDSVSKASSVVTKTNEASALFEQAIKAAPIVKTALSFIKQSDPVKQGAVYHRVTTIPATLQTDEIHHKVKTGEKLIMDEHGNIKSSTWIIGAIGIGALYLMVRR